MKEQEGTAVGGERKYSAEQHESKKTAWLHDGLFGHLHFKFGMPNHYRNLIFRDVIS